MKTGKPQALREGGTDGQALAFSPSGVRLAVLLHGSLESFLLVTFLTGTPAMLLLLAWSIRHSIRSFSALELSPHEALRAAA